MCDHENTKAMSVQRVDKMSPLTEGGCNIEIILIAADCTR